MKKIPILFVILFFFSCSQEKEEVLLVKNYKFDVFWGVTVHNNIDFEIHRTDSFCLQVIASEDLIENIGIVPAPSSQLEIHNYAESPFKAVGRPLLKVFEAQPVVFSFAVDGTAQCVQTDTIDIIDFTVIMYKHSGNLIFPIKSKVFTTENYGGNTFMDISGSVQKLNIIQRGEGRYCFNKLQADTINILQEGGGNIYIGNCKQLIVNMNFSGNIYYEGLPEIQMSGSGTGKLIKTN